MTEYTTIRVTREAKQIADERKPDHMTWSDYLASEEFEPELRVDATVDAAEIAKLTADEIEKRLR